MKSIWGSFKLFRLEIGDFLTIRYGLITSPKVTDASLSMFCRQLAPFVASLSLALIGVPILRHLRSSSSRLLASTSVRSWTRLPCLYFIYIHSIYISFRHRFIMFGWMTCYIIRNSLCFFPLKLRGNGNQTSRLYYLLDSVHTDNSVSWLKSM